MENEEKGLVEGGHGSSVIPPAVPGGIKAPPNPGESAKCFAFSENPTGATAAERSRLNMFLKENAILDRI